MLVEDLTQESQPADTSPLLQGYIQYPIFLDAGKVTLVLTEGITVNYKYTGLYFHYPNIAAITSVLFHKQSCRRHQLFTFEGAEMFP